MRPVRIATQFFLRRRPVSGFRSPVSFSSILAAHFLLLTSFFFVSCHSPFQPEVQFSPRLNVYSVLFANANEIYVRVTSVTRSQSGDVAQPVHGADVSLIGTEPYEFYQQIRLVDTTGVIDGDTASFYFAPISVIPGETYMVSVSKNGYPTASASATVPDQYTSVPDQNFYSALQNPEGMQPTAVFNAPVSRLASAAFARVVLEYRGLDANGNFRQGSFNVMSIDTLNPFTELTTTSLPVAIDSGAYKHAFRLAHTLADSMTAFHLYADIIVTQVDNNFYRFFVTSLRTVNPLVMRTDKIVFSNIFNGDGTGIVAGVSVDTTRVFLY